jgi:hypothetical protein
MVTAAGASDRSLCVNRMGGAALFDRGWVLKYIYGSFLLLHTVFPKNTLRGVYLFAGRKANRGSKKYRKIIFVKECF